METILIQTYSKNNILQQYFYVKTFYNFSRNRQEHDPIHKNYDIYNYGLFEVPLRVYKTV
jgi:hypothetical protein